MTLIVGRFVGITCQHDWTNDHSVSVIIVGFCTGRFSRADMITSKKARRKNRGCPEYACATHQLAVWAGKNKVVLDSRHNQRRKYQRLISSHIS